MGHITFMGGPLPVSSQQLERFDDRAVVQSARFGSVLSGHEVRHHCHNDKNRCQQQAAHEKEPANPSAFVCKPADVGFRDRSSEEALAAHSRLLFRLLALHIWWRALEFLERPPRGFCTVVSCCTIAIVGIAELDPQLFS